MKIRQWSEAQQKERLDTDFKKFKQDMHQVRKKMFQRGTLVLTKEGSSLFSLRMGDWCLAYIRNTDEISRIIHAVCDAIYCIQRVKHEQTI